MNIEMNKLACLVLFWMLPLPFVFAADDVAFPSGDITLHGVVYRPEGKGPFPAVVYNHGSAAGMISKTGFDALGPVFASHGWVFFGPYRRGQGLSASAGPYIGDQIAAAEKNGGIAAAAETMVRLLATDHLNDQLAALAWLRKQSFVQANRIAVAGTSFGGIEVVLGAERGTYCAAIDDRLRTEPNVDYQPGGVAHIEDETKQFVGALRRQDRQDFLANVGTVNVAKDLDAIRKAVGDDKLTYLGYSYGTRIGSAYAEAYPRNVRAMILDGAVDPNADPIEADLRQAKGFQDAFNDFAADCAAKNPTCPLGTDPAKAVDVYHSLVDPMVDPNNQLIGRPVPTNDPRGLSYSDAIVGTIMALYSPTLWHHLTDGLTELVDHHGDTLLALADMYMRRDPHGHYSNATDARVAINCVDQPPITDRAKVIDEDRRSREIAPFMSYGTFTGDAPAGNLCVLAGATHDEAAYRLGARPGADRGGVDHPSSGDTV